MRLLRKRKLEHFDVPVQDMLLRVTGPEDFYVEVRAAGMLFWEQIQSYGIRNPAFRTTKRPLEVPETAPAIIREMAQSAAAAGATAIVSKPNGFHTALTYLKGLPRLHGALLIQGHRIGVTGALEIAA